MSFLTPLLLVTEQETPLKTNLQTCSDPGLTHRVCFTRAALGWRFENPAQQCDVNLLIAMAPTYYIIAMASNLITLFAFKSVREHLLDFD